MLLPFIWWIKIIIIISILNHDNLTNIRRSYKVASSFAAAAQMSDTIESLIYRNLVLSLVFRV